MHVRPVCWVVKGQHTLVPADLWSARVQTTQSKTKYSRSIIVSRVLGLHDALLLLQELHDRVDSSACVLNL